MMTVNDLIHPDWPAPDNVGAIATTRQGGVSEGPWSSLNLGDHCGDDPARVRANRDRLNVMLPGEPRWLKQVHGVRVLDADASGLAEPQADAAVCSGPESVLAILTADCLPVLLCDEDGTRIGAVHAGWRGLAGGVIEAAVDAMQVSPAKLMAWLGPAIGQDAYEVGRDVYESFRRRKGSRLVDAFRPLAHECETSRWHLDLSGAARMVLANMGVRRVSGGGSCTYSDSGRFYSYRRDGITGRQACLIWLKS